MTTTFLEQQQLKLVREALSGFPRDSYPRYRGIEANERLTLDSHPDGPMSLASVHATLNRIKNQLVVSPAYDEALQAQSAEHERQRLINEILTAAPPLVTGSTDREAERAKRLAREQWVERIKSMDIESLQRVRSKQQLKLGSVDGAKQIVKQA